METKDMTGRRTGRNDWLRRSVGLVALVGAVAACTTGTGASSAPSASPTPSIAPSMAPTPEPTPSPTSASTETPDTSAAPDEAHRFDVQLSIATAHTVTVEVIDWTGTVLSAGSGTPGDGASVPVDQVVVTDDGATRLTVTWIGGPCDAQDTLVLDEAGETITVVQEPCAGDAIGFDRIVVLEFDGSVSAASFRGVLQAGGDTPG